MNARQLCRMLFVGLLLLATVNAQAQTATTTPTAETPDEKLTAALLRMCREDTSAYTLTFAGQPKLKFEPREVLKWTNPVRHRQLGVVHLWLHEGRAEAMSTVFTSQVAENDSDNVVMHEFQSLSLRRITATGRDGQVRWSPAQPGLALQPIAGAPEPADSPTVRLRQMRTLAREYSAHSISYYGETARWELRLLAQPLYRYEPKSADLLDGAVFAFVSSAGTDPEIILPIEARKVGDRWAWHTAGARFSDHSLYLRHQDKDVWTFLNEKRDPMFRAGEQDTYRLFRDRVFDISTLGSTTRTNAKSER